MGGPQSPINVLKPNIGASSVCPPVETLHLDERPWLGLVLPQTVVENGVYPQMAVKN